MTAACSPKHKGCIPLHRQLVEDYRAARLADEQAREDAVGIYGSDSPEWAEWTAANPLVTFKTWLVQTTGTYGYVSDDEEVDHAEDAEAGPYGPEGHAGEFADAVRSGWSGRDRSSAGRVDIAGFDVDRASFAERLPAAPLGEPDGCHVQPAGVGAVA